MYSVQTINDVDSKILVSFSRIALQKARELCDKIDFVTIVPFEDKGDKYFFILFKKESCSIGSFGRVDWIVDMDVVLKNRLV